MKENSIQSTRCPECNQTIRTPDEQRCRRETTERQPLWATLGLIVVTIVGIIAIVYILITTREVPGGLVAITTSAVTAVVMSAGRRRL
jgi:hypothetical protein